MPRVVTAARTPLAAFDVFPRGRFLDLQDQGGFPNPMRGAAKTPAVLNRPFHPGPAFITRPYEPLLIRSQLHLNTVVDPVRVPPFDGIDGDSIQ